MPNAQPVVTSGEGWRITSATEYQLRTWENWLKYWQLDIDPIIRAAKAAGEISQAVQNWADLNGVYADCWTPQDQRDIDFLIRQRNIIEANINGVYAGKYFLQFPGEDFQIAARPDMPRSQYEKDIFSTTDESGLGIAPIIWVIVGGAITVGSLWGGVAIMKQTGNLLARKDARRTLELDASIAKTGNPATIKAWDNFKKQNAQALKARAKEAQEADEGGGLFSWIFGKGAGSKIAGSIGVGLIIVAAVLAFSKFGSQQRRSV